MGGGLKSATLIPWSGLDTLAADDFVQALDDLRQIFGRGLAEDENRSHAGLLAGAHQQAGCGPVCNATLLIYGRVLRMKRKAVLLRLRDADSRFGVTSATLKSLSTALGLSETDAIHKALADCARENLPQYEPDDGPLSRAQHRRIEDRVRKRHGPARAIESLFDSPRAKGARRDDKTVRSASRAR